MACQMTASQASVLKRRGYTLPELSVSPQDFNGLNRGLMVAENKELLRDLLRYLVSPKKSQLDDIIQKSPIAMCDTPVLPDTVEVIAEEEFEKYLTDIKLEDIIDTQDNTINEAFLSRLSNSNSKVALLPIDQFNEASNFLENYNFNDSDTTLVLPKSIDLITPNTPVIVRRKLKANRDEFDVYFPDTYTPTLLKCGLQDDGTFFRFPDQSGTFDSAQKTTMGSDFQSNENSFDEPWDAVTSIMNIENNNYAVNEAILTEMALNDESKLCNFGKTKRQKKNQNEIERKRRIEQHTRFQQLRLSIPRVSNKNKIAKISILKAATSYIKELNDEEITLGHTMMVEKRRNDFLMRKIAFLSKSR